MKLLEGITQRLQHFVERRSEVRVFDNQRVIVVWTDGTSQQVGCATVLGRSLRGLSIAHRLPLAKDYLIHVLTPEQQFAARVVWARGDEKGGEAGIVLIGECNRKYRHQQVSGP